MLKKSLCIVAFSFFLYLNNWIVCKRNRIHDVSNRFQYDLTQTENIGVFLIYGQSNAMNDSYKGYEVKNDVYMQLNAKSYAYEEPTLGGTGKYGNVWGRVGDKLIDSGVYDSVIFSLAGESGKNISYLSKYPNIAFLKIQYDNLFNVFGRVDGLLVHQGESDNRNANYYNDFEKFIDILIKLNINTPIYLARTSYCNGNESKITLEHQNMIIEKYNLHEGPNTDLYKDDVYRLKDRCHFSKLGLDMISNEWVQYILGSIK